MAKLDYFQDSGSNYDFHDKKLPPNLRRSLFDLSYVNTLTAKQGQLIPVWFSYTYPGDEFDVSIDNLIRVVNPPVVPLMSRQRVFFHLFKVDFSQLWTNWEQFMKKGWSGDYEGIIPRIRFKPYYSFTPIGGSPTKETSSYAERGSLPDFLGFNFGNFTDADLDLKVDFPALPFLAYQLIYRDYYLNMPIAYETWKTGAPTSTYGDLFNFFPDSEYDLMIHGENPVWDQTLPDDENAAFGPIGLVGLLDLRYRDFAPDYFTTCLPYVMKGTTPTTNLDVVGTAGAGVPLTWNDGTQAVFENFILRYSDDNVSSTPIWEGVNLDGTSAFSFNIANGSNFNYGSKNVVASRNIPDEQTDLRLRINDLRNYVEFGLTQIQLRQLWTDTLILEKMTRTDGSYGQFVNSFFGTDPSHWVNHRPTYVGGSYQPIVFTEVLQSTPSAEGGTLGTVGGKGISSSSSHLGSFSCTDFGCAMVIMSIMPDTYYSQGIMREHLYLTQADFPLPERSLLGPQPVYAEELYATPAGLYTKSLFGYQSRFDELRYRQNEVHGDVADLDNASFSPYVQQRKFSQKPNLNPAFLSTKGNVDNSWLSAPNEPAYLVQVANRVTCKRSLPYIAPPTAVLG